MAENWVHIGDAAKHVGEEIALKGWLANRRGSGKVQFLHRSKAATSLLHRIAKQDRMDKTTRTHQTQRRSFSRFSDNGETKMVPWMSLSSERMMASQKRE